MDESGGGCDSIELPDASYKLLSWKISDGAPVRVGETVAFAVPKSSDTSKGGQAAPSGFKRPTKRKKPGLLSTLNSGSFSKYSDSKLSSTATKSTAEANGSPVTKPESDGRIPILAVSDGIVHHNPDVKSTLCIGTIEPCSHPTYVEGLCVVCGKAQQAKENEDTKAKVTNMSRVTVAGQTVSVSKEEGTRMAKVEADRLRESKRLALVLDLDHTLVHATNDTRARKYWETRKDVRTLVLPLLDIKGVPQTNAEGRTIWMQHFVKLRPGVDKFLEEAQVRYEVGVYTAGTRQYAEQICIVLSRFMVGAHLDEPELAELRQRVGRMEKEVNKAAATSNEATAAEGKEDAVGEKRKRITFGVLPESERTDAATAEEFSSLKKELAEAESLESRALELRKQLFGTRIVSRTDVGDLGHDVKSITRIFPCGGTMAVIMDDREDVWANAGDNSSVRKGEPPENLLLVKPYHWKSFLGFADVNNKSGADLSGEATDGEGGNETDKQMAWSGDILRRIHERYYASQENETGKTMSQILKQMRAQVLGGAHIVLSGLVPLHRQDKDNISKPRPTVVRYTESLGAKLVSRVEPSITHVVAARDGTDKIIAARRVPGCFVVKASWLMDTYWSLKRGNEMDHLLGQAPLTPVDDNSEDSDSDFAAEFENGLMS